MVSVCFTFSAGGGVVALKSYFVRLVVIVLELVGEEAGLMLLELSRSMYWSSVIWKPCWPAKVDVKKLVCCATKERRCLLESVPASNQLFVDLKQFVVALVSFVEGRLSKLALRWRLRYVAEDTAECRSQVKAHVFADCLGIPGVLLVNAMARWK